MGANNGNVRLPSLTLSLSDRPGGDSIFRRRGEGGIDRGIGKERFGISAICFLFVPVGFGGRN